jgi:hypothetical protein
MQDYYSTSPAQKLRRWNHGIISWHGPLFGVLKDKKDLGRIYTACKPPMLMNKKVIILGLEILVGV